MRPHANSPSSPTDRSARRALALAPADGRSWKDLALVDRTAVSFARAGLNLADDPDVLGAVASSFIEAGDHTRGRAHLERGLAIAPERGDLHQLASHLAYRQRRPDAAIGAARRALAVDPAFVAALRSLRFGQLLKGDFESGFAALGTGLRAIAPVPLPLWDGRPTGGRRLLVVGEEGFGDMIQMARFLRLPAKTGFQVTVVAPRPLVRLLSSIPDIVVTETATPQEYDAWIPMMALPAAMPAAATAAVGVTPYLAPPASGPMIGPFAELTVGICWQGRRSHPHDQLRSLPVDVLAPLLEVPGVRFVSLDIEPAVPPIVSVPKSDFADTAFLIGQLDLVISVDTAVAHLGGALGVPTWVLLSAMPEWRWGTGGSSTVWYSTAKLYRATDRLSSTLVAVAADLRTEIRKRHDVRRA